MNGQETLFRRFQMALSAESFRETLEESVAHWNFESALALERFWSHALPEEQIKIVAGLRQIPPEAGRQAVRLLAIWAYGAPRDLKRELLKTLSHFRSPASLWRLWAIYTHTNHDEKKVAVAGIFAKLASGLFFAEALGAFESQGEAVKEALLDWAEAIPVLDEEGRLALERALFTHLESRVLENFGAFWRHRSALMLRHGLSLRRIFRNHLGGPVLSGVATPSHDLPPDLAAALMNQWPKPRLRLEPAAFWPAFLQTENLAAWGPFDPGLRASAPAYLAEQLPTWAHAQSLVPLHQTLDRLRLFDLELGATLVATLRGDGSFPFKQAILEHLLTWRLGPEVKADLLTVVHLLLSDTKHVRIFETLARVLVLHFGDGGMKTLVDAFSRHEDREHNLALLRGLLHALREDGAMKHLSPSGLLLVHQIAGGVSDVLKRDRGGEPLLFDRWCRLVALLQISERQSDLLELLPVEGPGRAALSALIALDTERSHLAARTILEKCLPDYRDHWELFSQAWGDLTQPHLREVRQWGDPAFQTLLAIPDLASFALQVLAIHPLGYCRGAVATAALQGPLLSRAWALTALEQYPPESFAGEIYKILEEGPEPLLYDRAVHLLIPLCDERLLKQWVAYYVGQRGEKHPLGRLLDGLVDRPPMLEAALKELLTYRRHPRFDRFAPLLRHFLKSWDGGDGPLPLDAVLPPRE